MWGNSALLPDGGILVVHQNPRTKKLPRKIREQLEIEFEVASGLRELVRFGRDGRAVWTRRLPVHHDVELTQTVASQRSPTGIDSRLRFIRRRR